MSNDKTTFERIYAEPGAGWSHEQPPAELRALVESGQVQPGKAIDIGCGEGFYGRRRPGDMGTGLFHLKNTLELALRFTLAWNR